MIAVVGVFESRTDAQGSVAALSSLGVSEKYVTLLVPQSSEKDLEKEMASVPQTQGEQPGMVKTIGAVAGGAVGAGLGEAVASLLVPGVGPVLAIGLAGGALLGAISGGAAGGKLESSVFSGVPEEELFVYQDALRRGRTVIVAMAQDESQAQAVRGEFERAGVESIDRAREMWWVGLRGVEKESYESTGGTFEADEPAFRRGFQAALRFRHDGKSPDVLASEFDGRTPTPQEREAFRRGFERGLAYLRSTQNRARSA
jgi:outer membrane lipoprotein SlyB